MTIDEMRTLKREGGFSYEQISAGSGLPLGTVQKVLGGVTRSPRRETILALERFFRQQAYLTALSHLPADPHTPQRTDSYAGHQHTLPQFLSEAAVQYGRAQGQFTLEDFLRLPKDRSFELIDGSIYEMNSPGRLHQRIVSKLGHYFERYIEEHNGDCEVLPSTDTQLDRDERTVVAPDLAICCGTEDRDGRVFGAPDLVIEVLSPSTRSRDLSLKLHKYQHAGVREYWIIDADKERVLVYRSLPSEAAPDLELSIYAFSDRIPVGIYDGDLVIDLAEMRRQLARYFPTKE